ncbi:MAG: FAD-dependent oxidoreductase, partial [Planctomycetota bacterium]
ARPGKCVQACGAYAGERTGAGVRAYTRVSDATITNRNKVYRPDHLLVLDPTLLDEDVAAGLVPGGTLLLNSTEPPAALAGRFPSSRLATLDATAIARRHRIGTRSVVIVNTTIAGAFARLMDVAFEILAETYEELGFESNIPAAREAYEGVQVREAAVEGGGGETQPARPAATRPVVDLVEHVEGPPPGLKTGSWRSQLPRYIRAPAPCAVWCPAGNDVEGFVQALARSGEAAAAEILGRTSPLAAVCGRVCPGFCMQNCNRCGYDGAVNTRGIERWIADHNPVAERDIPRLGSSRSFAIVGGGPAGLSAAYQLARAGHRPTIFEAERQLGGVLRTGIPTYRLPRDVLDREILGILNLGVEARCGEPLRPQDLADMVRDHDAVLLATGLQRLRSLDVPGAHLPGVEQGIRFLHRGNIDGSLWIGGHVVVLSGGNTAIDCARTALRSGAARVTVAYRRTREEMPAIAEEIEEAIHEGIDFLFQRAPMAFRQGGGGRVAGVELAEVEMGPPDESGRRRPNVTARTSILDCDAVLLALGQSADMSLLPEGWRLVDGAILDGGAQLPVFASGDLATGEGTVAHAIGDGRRIALRALSAIDGGGDAFPRADPSTAVSPRAMRFAHFEGRAPSGTLVVPAPERIRTFDEVNLGLPDRSEARRCFSCGDCTFCDTCLVYCPEGIIFRKDGAYEIDYEYCKGCGVCVVECPRGAMEMVTP